MATSFLINSLFGGGAEKQFVSLLNKLPYEKVYSLDQNETELKLDNFTSLSSHTTKTYSALKTLWLPFYSRNLSKKLSRDEKLISFMTRANLVNLMSAEKSGHRAIISERTNPLSEFAGFRKIYLSLMKKFYKKAETVLVNNEGVKKDLINIFNVPEERLKKIPNFIDIKKALSLAEESLGAYEEIFRYPVLINVGRLTSAKGQWRLLKIFSHIKKTNKDLKLLMLGNGELKDYLLQLSNSLKLKTFDEKSDDTLADKDVYFISDKNPYKYMKKSRIFVFTSLWEGFPNAMLEAMALGLPVASANCKYGPLELLSINPDIENYSSSELKEADFGFLLPKLKGEFIKNHCESLDESENIWCDFLINILKDEKKLSLYSQLSFARAKDFEEQKIIPLWNDFIQNG